MEKIGLLIDSTTYTRDDLIKYDFIKAAQLKVSVDGTEYRESQLTVEDMKRYLDEHRKLQTSQPSPIEFLNLFKEFFEEGYSHVITIVLSEKVSGTYQSAMIAKSMIDFNLEVSVHSPNAASFGVALGVKEIAEQIKTGTTYEELVNRYYKLFKDPVIAFTLADLKHLFKGGRLNRVQALIGTVLRIKPIIEMIDGKLELVKKERTNNACIEYFKKIIDEKAKNHQMVHLDVINLNMDDMSNKLIEYAKNTYPDMKIHVTDYVSPVFFAHLGDKGYGISILTE